MSKPKTREDTSTIPISVETKRYLEKRKGDERWIDFLDRWSKQEPPEAAAGSLEVLEDQVLELNDRLAELPDDVGDAVVERLQ